MNVPLFAPIPEAAPTALQALYVERSKHSSYQLIHPTLAAAFGATDALPAGKRETERQRYFDSVLRYEGQRVLDIGANTGYFSFAALAQGAASVLSIEGNPRHAQFIAAGAQAIDVGDRLQVRNAYYDFSALDEERHDLTFCLNVLHHLGDDFGDPALTITQARRNMLACLNRMSAVTGTLVLQLGFNWKGDRRHPLFAGGEKAALIEFVSEGIDASWSLDEVAVVNVRTRQYEPVGAHNIARVDALGEFMNRPIFVLRSRRTRV